MLGRRKRNQALAIGRGLVVGRRKREAWFDLNKTESLLVYPLFYPFVWMTFDPQRLKLS